MTLQTASLRAFTDAATEAVAREIATIRRAAQAERQAHDEAFRARMADIETRISALDLLELRLDSRIDALRNGEQGERGEPGMDGAPGKLPTVREWQDGVCYEADVRTFAGSTWQALRDTGKKPGHDDWISLAERGTDGADGRDGEDGLSFRLRGTWIEIGEYRALDVVTKGGASFAARTDNPGPCPGEGWQMLARGKTGDRGERGPPGGKGDQGEPGLPVVAMSINDEAMVTLTNGDGSVVTCDFYPILSKLMR